MRFFQSTATAAIFIALTCSAQAATADNPAVVELFTSQGCSSCPPADANVQALASRPDVLALAYHVTYWDKGGWHDTFDSGDYTQRQRDYESPLGEHRPFTPQVIVDGARDTVGTSRADIEKLIAASSRANAPTVQLSGNVVAVGAGSGDGDVWLVRYDPHVVQVAVERGENAGATLPQSNVVHELTKLGSWNGAAKTYAISSPENGMKTAVLLQHKDGGSIIAVARD